MKSPTSMTTKANLGINTTPPDVFTSGSLNVKTDNSISVLYEGEIITLTGKDFKRLREMISLFTKDNYPEDLL